MSDDPNPDDDERALAGFVVFCLFALALSAATGLGLYVASTP